MSLHTLYSLSSSCRKKTKITFSMSDAPSFFFFYSSLTPFFLLSPCLHLTITFLFNCMFFTTQINADKPEVLKMTAIYREDPPPHLFFLTLCQTMLLPNIIIICSIFTIEFGLGQTGHRLSCFKAIAAFQFPTYGFSSRSRCTQSPPCIIYLEQASKSH